MKLPRPIVKATPVGLLVVLYEWIMRWKLVNWGAAFKERAPSCPGDVFIREPTHSTTHAVTISAPASEIWP